ncbi:MAG: hypothetical protein F6J93_36085 [Oscillatoria sp. SIO1A7]|nr:hypothetical protein [Oscillatoria sp. SIO1A7]
MGKIATVKGTETARISAMVEELMQSDRFYQESLDKSETIELVVSMFEEKKLGEKRRPLDKLDDEELTDIIDFAMTISATAGMLDDLTPEQMERFDTAVEGR